MTFNCFNLPKPAAAKSLAIPLTDKQSGRLGVILTYITGSSRLNNLEKCSPIFSDESNSIMPS